MSSSSIPLAKIFDTIFRGSSDTVDVIVYRRPDYSELDDNNKPVFFDDLYSTVGPTARHMKGGAG